MRVRNAAGVQAGQYGWYSSLAVAQDSVLVSAYDSDYGDLVVSEFDNEGQLQSVTYVDGFTTTIRLSETPTAFALA